jgi:putative glutamine amidotransferase
MLKEVACVKPLIGITTVCEHRLEKVFDSVNYNYIKSVYAAGGMPALIPVLPYEDDMKIYIDSLDGLLFTGGNDISPLRYREDPVMGVTSISDDRDICELALFKEGMKRDMPMLGICRGIQLMNVGCGGTLYQDIHCQVKNALGHLALQTLPQDYYHRVIIERDSKLHGIFGKCELNVNSFHHQSVKELGRGFKVTAKSPDGIIEGIESTEKTFVVGVQWHPEGLVEKHGVFLKLFEAFVDEAADFNRRKHEADADTAAGL